MNSSTNATNFQWYFGDGTSSTQFEPIHEYEYDENCTGYSITLIASDGNCRDTARNVIPCNEETIFYVPNTFTPDGDNFNQTFFPVFYSGFDPFNFEMLIFDRWGELIFETHHYETTRIIDSSGVTIVPAGLIVDSNYSVEYYDSNLESYVTKTNIAVPVTNYDY